MSKKIIQFPIVHQPEKAPEERYKRRPDGLYQLEFSYTDSNGKKARKVFYGQTQAAAKKKRDEFKKLLNSGMRIDTQDTTVSQWADEWLAAYKATVSHNTRKTYIHDIEIIKEAIGRKKLVDVTASDVQKILNTRAGLSSSAIKKTSMTLKSLFEKARINRMILYNPCEGLQIPVGESGSHDAIPVDLRNLITETWRGHRFGRAAMIMLYAGLRRGEVMALDLERDIENGTLVVREAIHHEGNAAVLCDPKTEAGKRSIPIMPQLAEVVEGQTGLVLSTKAGGHMTSTAFKRAFESYITYLEEILNGSSWRWATPEQRKVWKHVNLRCHDLRHTFCSMLYEAGVSLKSAQAWMGHDDVAVTMKIYTHLSTEKENADTDLAKKFFSQLPVKNPVSRYIT